MNKRIRKKKSDVPYENRHQRFMQWMRLRVLKRIIKSDMSEHDRNVCIKCVQLTSNEPHPFSFVMLRIVNRTVMHRDSTPITHQLNRTTEIFITCDTLVDRTFRQYANCILKECENFE